MMYNPKDAFSMWSDGRALVHPGGFNMRQTAVDLRGASACMRSARGEKNSS